MRRRLFAVVSAISLLLCFALVGLWVRSYWITDQVSFTDQPEASRSVRITSYRLWSQHGGIGIGLRRVVDPDTPGEKTKAANGWQYVRRPAEDSQTSNVWQTVGFWYKWETVSAVGATVTSHAVAVPHVLPALLLGVPSGFLLYRRYTRSSRKWECRICRYNLTGNISGVCPECGTPVSKEPAEKGPRRA
jgi:hypothetical protein